MSSSEKPKQGFWHLWWRPILIGLGAVILNVAAYLLLPRRLVARLGMFGYIGAFAVAAIANATVLIPVPYYPIIARLAQAYNVWGVIIAAAAGSAMGESVAFFVGRSGKAVIEQTKMNGWIKRQIQHPWRAALLLFGLSAPPNPAFDVAGLLAGAFDIPFWLFLVSVFFGRIVRMGLVAFVGLRFDWI